MNAGKESYQKCIGEREARMRKADEEAGMQKTLACKAGSTRAGNPDPGKCSRILPPGANGLMSGMGIS